MAIPPCHRSKNTAFSAPDRAPGRSIRAALTMCRACPLVAACAALALQSGTSLDGSRTGPAEGVIQAGVICRGDDDTARALAEVAGVPVPVYRAQRPRPKAPKRCVECGHPMVSWTRGEVPEGHRMHYGRGRCTGCRDSYRAELASMKA